MKINRYYRLYQLYTSSYLGFFIDKIRKDRCIKSIRCINDFSSLLIIRISLGGFSSNMIDFDTKYNLYKTKEVILR